MELPLQRKAVDNILRINLWKENIYDIYISDAFFICCWSKQRNSGIYHFMLFYELLSERRRICEDFFWSVSYTLNRNLVPWENWSSVLFILDTENEPTWWLGHPDSSSLWIGDRIFYEFPHGICLFFHFFGFCMVTETPCIFAGRIVITSIIKARSVVFNDTFMHISEYLVGQGYISGRFSCPCWNQRKLNLAYLILSGWFCSGMLWENKLLTKICLY